MNPITYPKYHKFFLGIDAGGTKTQALLADASGRAIGLGRCGAGNWEAVGFDGFAAAVQESTFQACHMAGITPSQIGIMGMGLAGFDWGFQQALLLDALKPLEFEAEVHLVNDTTLGLLAGASQGWGVSVVAGTGCNCRGWNRNKTREGRVAGGGSRWSGEYAGGIDIVLRAMRAVTFEWNQRGGKTALSALFLQQTGAKTLDELVEGVYFQRYETLLDGDFVIKIFQVAHQGDPAALEIMRWAGDELGQLACGVIRQCQMENEPVEVILIGSLHDGHPLMTESLMARVHQVCPQATGKRLSVPPVTGGVLLAMEHVYGQMVYDQRDLLMHSTAELIQIASGK